MLELDRRLLLKAGTFGLGAFAIPGAALAFQNMRGFTHCVASGEPTQNSVLLWTRFVAGGDSRLDVVMRESVDGPEIASGQAVAHADRDNVAKTVVTGLHPNRWYYYQFVAPDGTRSPTGRTRTLPDGPVDRFNLGVFSCSNMPYGWFNAYGAAVERDDLDLVLHLGDYIYEYGVGKYPEHPIAERMIRPDEEILTLADYRLRYQSYRADADLQRLHQLWPMLSQWDDHEITNDSWQNGAENHQPDEGDFETRKRIARRVYREWMPVSDLPDIQDSWKAYDIGDLATILLTESRLNARDRQLDVATALDGASDPEAALVAFREQKWRDPSRTMLGADQEEWLADRFRASTRAGTKWQIWAQQTVMGELRMPPETLDWVPESAPDMVRERVAAGVMASRAEIPLNLDSWDGYPAARERSLSAAQEADAELIVLSGDSHNAWAFDLAADGRPAGVEFAGHSVSSPGFETYFPGVPAAEVDRALQRTNPDLKWANLSNRGYMTVEVSPERATSTWHFLETVRRRSTAIAGTHRASVARGQGRLDTE